MAVCVLSGVYALVNCVNVRYVCGYKRISIVHPLTQARMATY